ncbi:hypothetical protein L2E82_12614 [Cichorium intybus]|uniref:Uncharacterized protein n=1 Tax=Cichorium intybus TaxID=13427 RepID=A0ACB9GHA6_CICIN|nr:hypothetical protein L2E82_12614 [Cichorium intybus]
MAFTMSKGKSQSISSPATLSETEDLRPGATDPITTQLQLAHHQSTATLDKEAVLRRIRYHRCLRKLKSTFESLVNRSPSDAYEKWSEPTDAFTSP